MEEVEGESGGKRDSSLAAVLAEGLAKLLLHNHLRGSASVPGRLERGDMREVGCCTLQNAMLGGV